MSSLKLFFFILFISSPSFAITEVQLGQKLIVVSSPGETNQPGIESKIIGRIDKACAELGHSGPGFKVGENIPFESISTQALFEKVSSGEEVLFAEQLLNEKNETERCLNPVSGPSVPCAQHYCCGWDGRVKKRTVYCAAGTAAECITGWTLFGFSFSAVGKMKAVLAGTGAGCVSCGALNFMALVGCRPQWDCDCGEFDLNCCDVEQGKLPPQIDLNQKWLVFRGSLPCGDPVATSFSTPPLAGDTPDGDPKTKQE